MSSSILSLDWKLSVRGRAVNGTQGQVNELAMVSIGPAEGVNGNSYATTELAVILCRGQILQREGDHAETCVYESFGRSRNRAGV